MLQYAENISKHVAPTMTNIVTITVLPFQSRIQSAFENVRYMDPQIVGTSTFSDLGSHDSEYEGYSLPRSCAPV
jgi:hypothetical protein